MQITVNQHEFNLALEQVKSLLDPADRVEINKERYFASQRDIPYGRFMIDYRAPTSVDKYEIKVIQIDYFANYNIDQLVTIMFSQIETELRKPLRKRIKL